MMMERIISDDGNEVNTSMSLDRFRLFGKAELLSKKYCRISIVGSDKPSMMESYWAIGYTRRLVYSGVIIVSSILKSRVASISAIATNTAIELGGHGVMISRRSFGIRHFFDSFFRGLEPIGNVHLMAIPAESAARHKRLRECNYFAASISDAILVIGGDSTDIIDQVSEAARLGKPIFWHRHNCKPPQKEDKLFSKFTIYSLFNHRRMKAFLPDPINERGVFKPNDMRNLSQFKWPLEWRGLDG